jgi:hypothetical protein
MRDVATLINGSPNTKAFAARLRFDHPRAWSDSWSGRLYDSQQELYRS